MRVSEVIEGECEGMRVMDGEGVRVMDGECEG